MNVNLLSNRLKEKELFFREFSIWPDFSQFNTEAWLGNFCTNEIPVAERLLTNFTFFNEKMTNALICAAIQNYFFPRGVKFSGVRDKTRRLP